jgi:hypothetical protein
MQLRRALCTAAKSVAYGKSPDTIGHHAKSAANPGPRNFRIAGDTAIVMHQRDAWKDIRSWVAGLGFRAFNPTLQDQGAFNGTLPQ